MTRRGEQHSEAMAITQATRARSLSRRRVLTICAAAAGVPLLVAGDRMVERPTLYRWDGTSLGSPSRLLLYHPSRATAEQIVRRCVDEIERLERIFALYRADSELSRLNVEGALDAPSLDLLALLSFCQRLSALSDGAFDVTVQPLWNLYAAHFFRAGIQPKDGPAAAAIERARELVGWQKIDITPQRVRLARAGMGLTLNGIAQGYVTDRVTAILREHGCNRLLADMGRSEMRAIAHHADGRAWRIGLVDPRRPESFAMTMDISDTALCTSGGYGTAFERTGRYHHLFDPTTGASANHYIGVSVLAPTAMVADALSTALYVTRAERTVRLLASFPAASALITWPDGKMRRLGA